MHRFLRQRVVSFAMACALLFVAIDACAQRSYFTLYDQDYGLNVGEIAALAQDDTGFLWIGAHRGLLRFDGRNFVAWAPEVLDEVVYQLAYGPHDELIVRASSGRGWRRVADGLSPLAGPDGKQIVSLESVDFDRHGTLWAVIGAQLWRRDANNSWSLASSTIPADEKIERVYAIGDDIVVLTDQAAWRLRDAQTSELVRAKDIWFAASDANGSIWLTTHFTNKLWRVDADGAHDVERPQGRALDLRARGKTMWLSLDRQLVGYEANALPRTITIADDLPSGGPLLVDRENTLWLGTFVGLVKFPQPDTWKWGEAEGLPSEHAYGIVVRDGYVFVSTWSGLAHLKIGEQKKFVADFPPYGGIVCDDPVRGLWTSDTYHLLRWDADHFQHVSDWPQRRIIEACARGPDDALWFATSEGLSVLATDATLPRDVRIIGTEAIDQIWFDAHGNANVALAHQICRLRENPSESTSTLEHCVDVATKARVNVIAQLSPNETWLSANDGIFRYDGSHVSRLSGNHLIEGGVANTISKSVDDSWWISGSGVLARVRPCGHCDEAWRLVESPARWQGLPGNSAIAVQETSDGDLWIAGNRGVWHVPKGARTGPSAPPPIVPVRLSIDGNEKTVLGETRDITPDAHRVELEFAALSYRDRTLLRYRSRLKDDADWSAVTRSPVLQFADLEPGDYRAEMSASLDGEHWSNAPASVAFHVLPPWYRTWWAELLAFALLVALAVWLYRLRVAALIRVERERTRIAMDLHDELGSGLGSIGMLAGVAAREDLDTGETRKLVREIADLSGLLGSGLRSLVWSLRSGRAGMAELGSQIADHARRLFPGESPQLSVQLPASPAPTPLPPELRRHVLLFALEALHNVARHSRAQHVALSLQPVGHDGLRMVIEDDGAGFETAAHREGTGLESMRRRAGAIGATMELSSAHGSGTRVVLERGASIA